MTKQSTKGYIPTKTADLSKFPKIKGYDFNQKFSFSEFIKAYSTTGIQASRLGAAIEIMKAMRREKATTFLSYTSNMVSSGVREIIRYLVQNNQVDVLITNAGGIEEDFIKCFDKFSLGDFNANGKMLNDQGINRIGNIFVTNDFYAFYEIEMHKIFDICYEIQKKENRPLCTSEIIYQMGKYMDDQKMHNREESIIYWAYKNKIPIFSPAFTDGSTGDMVFFHRQKKKDFYIDIGQDMDKIVKIALNAEKTGVICLGGGSPKHFALNAQIFREGTEYTIYVNTHSGDDASDSGAETSEAVTWTKIKHNAPQIKVVGDASIIFPLIVAGAFSKE
jgi:deoxyhypusine synthase